MTGIILKRTGQHLISLCGDPCKDKTLHFVYSFILDGKVQMALYCNRCATMTITNIALPEVIHAFSDPLSRG